MFVRSSQNRVVLLDNKEKLLAKTLKGPVALEIKKQKLTKILFLTKLIY